MEFRPILSALTRNKVGTILIALQVALTLAIVTNSVFIIVQRIEKMNRPSGLDEKNLFAIASLGFAPDFDRSASLQQDLATIRAMPGVVAATAINSLPLSGGGWGMGVSTRPLDPNTQRDGDAEGSTLYLVDQHGIATFGTRLVEGRNFRPEEVRDRPEQADGFPPIAIVTKALADRLFDGQSAVGRTIYINDDALTVVGVVERLQAPWVDWDDVEHSVLLPERGLGVETNYLIRAAPGERDRLMKAVEQKLGETNRGRIVRGLRDYDAIRAESYRRDAAMTTILIAVIVGLLAITGLGIVGMASFWVTRRYKQIGTRRALGARRVDIVRYFQLENFIITSIGLALGVLLAYAFNYWLMQTVDAQRLGWYYVAVGALGVYLLGQLAVAGPSSRAARVSPAVATRNV